MDEVEKSVKLARAMHLHTMEYLGSARRLRERVTAPDGLEEHFPAVAVMADALAAEVALKAFIVQQQRIESPGDLRTHLGRMNRHHLSDLFGRVSGEVQSAISERVTERMNGRIMILATGYPGEVGKISYTGHVGFPQLLESHSCSFETWRYPYEQPFVWVAHSFGTALAEVLEETLCRMLYPDGMPTALPRGE